MNPTGVTSSSASCTSLNVAPYAIVAAISASSGTSGRAVSHVSGTGPLTSSGSTRQPGQRLVIGSRRSLPNAFGETRTPGRGLPALVLVAVDHARDAAREVGVVPARDQLDDREVVFDVALDDRVEHVVRRQRVGVELAGRQLRRRRLLDDGARNDLATRRAR